jgi:DNA-directed RNA polymerase specialized sigma24 family protein
VPTTPQRQDAIGAFFAANADRLHTAVRASARAPEPVIEDACQTAWAILLRRPDIELTERGLAWLSTVATREAWRLTSSARETPSGSLQTTTPGDDSELPEPAGPHARSAEEHALARIEHRERVEALKALKARERQALCLHGLGHTYAEVAELTGSTYTAVISGRPRQRRRVAGRARWRHVADGGVAAAVRPFRGLGRCARGCCSCLEAAADATRPRGP